LNVASVVNVSEDHSAFCDRFKCGGCFLWIYRNCEQDHVIRTTLSSDIIASNFSSTLPITRPGTKPYLPPPTTLPFPFPLLKFPAELTSEMPLTLPTSMQTAAPRSESTLTRWQILKLVFYFDFSFEVIQYTKPNYVVQEE
jgi:hypothetical protein